MFSQVPRGTAEAPFITSACHSSWEAAFVPNGTRLIIFIKPSVKNAVLFRARRNGLDGYRAVVGSKGPPRFFGDVHVHDEALQLFALILADDIAAQRCEFHGDFFLGHGIARITLGNIDADGM
jgi:hypothetical protein